MQWDLSFTGSPQGSTHRRTAVIQGGGNGRTGKSPSYSPQRNWLLIHASVVNGEEPTGDRWTACSPGASPHLCHFLWSQGTFHLLPGETCGCHLIQGHPSITDGHLALCLSSCSAKRWTVNMSTCKCAQSLQPWFICWAISLEVLLTLQHPNKFKQGTWCGLVEMTQMPGSWRRNLRGK